MSANNLSRRTHRWAIGSYFFIAGITFASWASRIPNIKEKLQLNDAELGGILFALPAGSMVSLPISGWLVSKLGSRTVMLIAAIIYPILLLLLGSASTTLILTILLFCFGLLGNMMNISVNTQAVAVEELYGRSILASFHGIWSLAGFTGAAVGTLMISFGFDPLKHFSIIAAAMILLALLMKFGRMPKDAVIGNQPLFVKPDIVLLKLGLISFCCMAAEGTMFDWSGIYFQKIVEAPTGLVTLGYSAFMGTMALGRFLGDGLVLRFGRKEILQGSGIIIAIGLLIAVFIPTIVFATIGFLLVGFGVSSVVPIVYSQAGKSDKMSAGMALAAVSSIGFLGFFIGPPLIGFIAEAFGLQWSFGIIALLGFGTTILAGITKFKN
ncbi:MAG TPA: MFS transporter [Sediminibacterium sp.]|uniref:MFS transporter n=1 Tax=Sediminibacterium sp. TaxID=1917865 RepID=UPI0008C75A11|nr:MFS transporter [Sediminibacterium sp.]OHC84925.1 MAG: MFS transporter [Sphingobacteriia bacterium RIFOXYC2_FULL_35_18]OHC87983.1 MAG: MFS transporter [Sphingobacteriia bacterium RIFOXYD2_FULL_35_12]HLD53343.1 MFS transporter [Sediminibacterium sp.]